MLYVLCSHMNTDLKHCLLFGLSSNMDICTFLYLFIHSRLEPWFMFIQTDQFLSLTEEQKWGKDYTLKWCRLVKKWKLKECKKCLVMGKTTDRYCVRHQKIVNKGFRIAFDIPNFFLELKELRNLKIFTKNSKITPDLKESYSFFLHLEKNA